MLTEQREKNKIPILGNVAAGTPILAQECVDDYLTFDCGGREGEYRHKARQCARTGAGSRETGPQSYCRTTAVTRPRTWAPGTCTVGP